MLSIIARDITERRDTQKRTEVMNALLKLFTVKITRKEYLVAVCGLLRDWSGCRYVGVRMTHFRAIQHHSRRVMDMTRHF